MPLFGFGKEREKTIKVPFQQAVRGGQLLEGKAVGVKGKIDGDSISVSLMTGPDYKGKERDDTALLVNYRAKDREWVLNSMIQNKWQVEQRAPIDEDLKDGEEVYIRIEPKEREFTIFANGQKIGDRTYSVPLNMVNHVLVEGDIKLHRVAFEGKFYMVPFEYDLPRGFRPGGTLTIVGRPEDEAKSFNVIFAIDDDCTAALFNPRFKDNVVVRNTKIDNKWQDEERSGEFPFTAGEQFDMTVECKDNKFEFFVNGHKVCDFFHRVPPTQIRKIELTGNLEVNSISLAD